MSYTVDDAIEAMAAVCRGEVTATPDDDPAEVYAGNVTFRLSSGWTIVVFNDCGEWDYVDSAIAPDGTQFEPWADVRAARGQPIAANVVAADCDRVAYWQPCGRDPESGCPHWGEFS